jgi:F-type H+-transporting ATPase subunit delta
MNGTRVAKRYAKALHEAAESAGDLEAVAKDVRFVAALMELREIRAFCSRPSLSRDAARKFAETALFPGIRSEKTLNFVKTVLANGRLAVLPLLSEAFEEILVAKSGVVAVEAVFASEPDAELLKEIATKMRTRVGGEVKVRTRLDGRLIKGFRLLWNSRLIDRSVAGGVRDMRLALKR